MTYYPSHPTRAMSISSARLTAATVAGRLAGTASRLARRGTGASIQGKVMLTLDPSALAKLLVGKRIAMVSGTNGKTTTTHFLAAAVRASLDHDASRLVHNADGANLHHGIASALSERPASRDRHLGDRRAGGRRHDPAGPARGAGAAELQPRPARSPPRDQGARPQLAQRAGGRGSGRAGGGRQRRRAADRLGGADRPAGGLGGHRDDLDPGRVAVPEVRRQPGPDAARPHRRSERRLALHRLRPGPAEGRLPGRERHHRRPSATCLGSAAQGARRVQRQQRRLRAGGGRADGCRRANRDDRHAHGHRRRPVASPPPGSATPPPGCCWPRTRPAGPRRCRWRRPRPLSWPSTRPRPTVATCPGCGTWSTSSSRVGR